MARPTPKDDEPPRSWFDDASSRLAAEDETRLFQLSEEGCHGCYEAAIRVMLNIAPTKIAADLGIPEIDISLIQMIFVAETNPNHPGILYLGEELITEARRSYLMARGKVLWQAEYGSLAPHEHRFLQTTVEASLLDGPRKFMATLSPIADPEFEEFEIRLSLLIINGQQRIMDELKKDAGQDLLNLIGRHEEILGQQLQLLSTLKSMRDPSPALRSQKNDSTQPGGFPRAIIQDEEMN